MRAASLLLYGATDFVEPLFQLQLNPLKNKTARVWHCLHAGDSWRLAAGYYAYRVQGPRRPPVGLAASTRTRSVRSVCGTIRFPPEFSREAARQPGRNDGRAILGVLPRTEQPFDWGGTPPPRHTHTQLSMSYMSKGSPRERDSGCLTRSAATFFGVNRGRLLSLQELSNT